eukprot:4865792-Pyramimonas_sp.AAC.2
MEVGVLDGSSMRMWHEWLPHARIVGVDIASKTHLKAPDGSKLNTIQADQTNRTQMETLIREWKPDVFLEDGCHREYCQQTTLSIVLPLLKSGAIYIIEDLHVCPYKKELQSTCMTPLTHGLLIDIAHGKKGQPSECIPNLEVDIIPSIANISLWSRPKCGECCSSTTALLHKW